LIDVCYEKVKWPDITAFGGLAADRHYLFLSTSQGKYPSR
jgi:hypothetical protein